MEILLTPLQVKIKTEKKAEAESIALTCLPKYGKSRLTLLLLLPPKSGSLRTTVWKQVGGIVCAGGLIQVSVCKASIVFFTG